MDIIMYIKRYLLFNCFLTNCIRPYNPTTPIVMMDVAMCRLHINPRNIADNSMSFLLLSLNPIKNSTHTIIESAMAIVAGVHITDLLNVTKDNIPRKPVLTPCFIEYNLYDE